jgi:hypothetical protein
MLGFVYFRIPCVKKIKPTARRMNTALAEPSCGRKKKLASDLIRSTDLCLSMPILIALLPPLSLASPELAAGLPV